MNQETKELIDKLLEEKSALHINVVEDLLSIIEEALREKASRKGIVSKEDALQILSYAIYKLT